jgi:exopolysaccharide biosynthesis polyprenyl glycosylphosphotransferase
MKSRASHSSSIHMGIDGMSALALALASAVYGNMARIPAGNLRQFLALRVTLLNVIFAAGFVLCWISCCSALGLYQQGLLPVWRMLRRAAKACALIASGLAAFLYVSRTAGPILRIAVLFLVSSLVFETVRLLGGRLLRFWMASRDPHVVVIAGSGRKAAMAWRQIRTRHHGTVKLLGFVDDRAVCDMAPDVADRYLGTMDQLDDILLRHVVDELLIALPTKSCYDRIAHAIAIAEQVGVEVVYMQDLYVTTRQRRRKMSDEATMFTALVASSEPSRATLTIKRALDIMGAVSGLLLLSPLFLLTAFAIRATSPGPVFFVQERYGYRRRKFRMYKVRSMVADAPQLMAQLEERNEAVGPIFKIRKDPRITPLGQILRTTSIDELPQLWNVLIGNMSLVGPRPMSIRDVSRFSQATLMRRFSVMPGITGLLQVSGRSDASFAQWIESDIGYIDNWSLGLDLRILARTIGVVLKCSGAV